MSGFNLPVRRVAGASTTSAGSTPSSNNSAAAAGGDASQQYSLLGEILPLSHTDPVGPPLGLSVAAIIAAATVKANSSDDEGIAGHNTSNKVPFQLPVRRVEDSSTKPDSSTKWESC